jgi:hypothetical protein
VYSGLERLQRGLYNRGLSIRADFGSGGASSVFTRTFLKNQIGCLVDQGSYFLVIDPEVLNRTDWYSYMEDRFGFLYETTFQTRLAPEELLSTQFKLGNRPANEQMFHTGISSTQFLGVACVTDDARNELLDALSKAGITSVNGVPIEEFVTKIDSQEDIHTITYFRKV